MCLGRPTLSKLAHFKRSLRKNVEIRIETLNQTIFAIRNVLNVFA